MNDPVTNPSPDVPPGAAASSNAELEVSIMQALRTVFDPEIPINICELGLVYNVQVNPAGHVHIRMTLTAPSCPEAGMIPGRVEQAARTVPGVTGATVELVWEPPWTPNLMSEAAKLQLGIF